MYDKKERDKLIEIGKIKVENVEKRFLKYLISSILAGMFIGLGLIFSASIATYLKGTPFEKLGLAIVFPMALSIVIMLKVELFTSATFILGFGKMEKNLKLSEVFKVLLVCYFGNWIGSLILSFLFLGTGSLDGSIGEYIANLAFTKINLSILQLVAKGILCNILVCLASWATYRMNSESGKLIIVFWCLFAMILCGFEHSIANMTTMTLGMLRNHLLDINLLGYLYNLLWVTLGNIIGGVVFVAFPIYIMYKD